MLLLPTDMSRRRYKQNKAWAAGVYKDDAEYFADVAKAYQAELKDLYDAGLRNVQFDDPGLAYFCSDVFRNGWAQDKDNIGTVDDLLDAYIKLYNDSISKVPEDFHTGMYL
jgi:methionine synthase II (cobalamin-independent)